MSIDIQLNMLNIHIFISGAGNYDTFKKTLKYYPISKIIILKGDGEMPEMIREAHKQIRDDCRSLNIEYEELTYKQSSFEDEFLKVIEIKKLFPEAAIYFNVTGGMKPEAIMAAIASLWVGGIAYYWHEAGGEPLELPIPKASVNNLSKNKLHMKILECICKKPQSQSEIRNYIGDLPGKNKPLSPQTLSQSLRALEKFGLIKKERRGRETVIDVTLSGKIAYSMLIKT